MYPILFAIGPIKIYSYGLMLGIGFLTASYLATKRARLFNIREELISNLALVSLVAGIIGARILYILLNLKYFITYPVEIFMLHRGGLVFYGGFVLAFLAGAVFARIKRLPILDTADLIIPFIALGHAIGRIGCFLNGCCYGKPTLSFLGVVFPGTNTRVYPVQLFSTLGLLIIFLILLYMQKRRRFKGEILLFYLILYGCFRFSIEFLRGDLLSLFYNLTATQIVSLVFVILGFCLYFIKLTGIWKKKS